MERFMTRSVKSLFYAVLCFGMVVCPFATPSPAQGEGGLVSALPPDHPLLHEGILAALDGDDEKAAKLFAEDREKRPGARPGGIDAAMAFLAPSFEFTGFGKMRFWLEKTAEDFPDDPEAYILLAEIALGEGRYLECSMLTRHARQLTEKYAGGAERKKEMLLKAEQIFSSVAQRRQRWTEAIGHLDKLREMEPANVEYLHQLGLMQYRADLKEEAAKTLEEAEAKDATRLPALVLLAQLSAGDGNSGAAKDYIAEALKKRGENPKVLLAAAELELNWSPLDRVRELVEKAREISPDSVDVVIMSGILHLYEDRFELAEEEFMSVVRSIPDDSRALTGLALSLAEQKDPAQLRRAFAIARKNVDAHPRSVDAQTTMAWVLVNADALGEAEKILLRLFDDHDLNSPGAYYLAVLFARQNRKDEAILFLESALETETNYPKKAAARKLLEELKKPVE